MKFYCLFTYMVIMAGPGSFLWMEADRAFATWNTASLYWRGNHLLILKAFASKWRTSISLRIYWPKQVTWPCLSSERVGMYNPPTGSGTKYKWSVIASTTSASFKCDSGYYRLKVLWKHPKGLWSLTFLPLFFPTLGAKQFLPWSHANLLKFQLLSTYNSFYTNHLLKLFLPNRGILVLPVKMMGLSLPDCTRNLYK